MWPYSHSEHGSRLRTKLWIASVITVRRRQIYLDCQGKNSPYFFYLHCVCNSQAINTSQCNTNGCQWEKESIFEPSILFPVFYERLGHSLNWSSMGNQRNNRSSLMVWWWKTTLCIFNKVNKMSCISWEIECMSVRSWSYIWCMDLDEIMNEGGSWPNSNLTPFKS